MSGERARERVMEMDGAAVCCLPQHPKPGGLNGGERGMGGGRWRRERSEKEGEKGKGKTRGMKKKGKISQGEYKKEIKKGEVRISKRGR